MTKQNELARKVAYVLEQIQAKGANLPALIAAFPEAGFTAPNHYSIADHPCPSCSSVLVSKKTPLGHDRDSWLRDKTGSSLRITSEDNPGDGFQRFSIVCMAGGGCDFSVSAFGFAKLARASVNDDAEFLERVKVGVGGDMMPIASPCVRSAGSDEFTSRAATSSQPSRAQRKARRA
jgi:hypothetical protein